MPYDNIIICPYCGYKDGDVSDIEPESERVEQCYSCEKFFDLYSHMSIDYETSKIDISYYENNIRREIREMLRTKDKYIAHRSYFDKKAVLLWDTMVNIESNNKIDL